MADIEVFLFDDVIVETEEAIESPPAVQVIDELPDLPEAFGVATMIVLEDSDTAAAAVMVDGLFFLGVSRNPESGVMRFIHTPAADAFFDEHYPGWRHSLELPMFSN